MGCSESGLYLYRGECILSKDVQKTDKPAENDRTVVKFSVRFRFGSVLVLNFLKPKIFGSVFGCRFDTLNRPNRTESYYNIFYI